MYTITTRLHRLIYVVFHDRRINISMSLNGTKHVYILTARLHIMICVMLCLNVHVCLYVPKVWKAYIRI
jgi:hypothetical protein